jgi:hypothetical protein
MGTPINHGRSLWQGGTLLLRMFVIAIDPLNNIADIATSALVTSVAELTRFLIRGNNCIFLLEKR